MSGIRAFWNNKKQRNAVLMATGLAGFTVWAAQSYLRPKELPAAGGPTAMAGVSSVEVRSEGPMDPDYRQRFERENVLAAERAEAAQTSNMVRHAEDVVPQVRPQPPSRPPPPPPKPREPHPSIAALIEGFKPSAPQVHVTHAPTVISSAPVARTGPPETPAGGGEAAAPTGEVLYKAGDMAAVTLITEVTSDMPGLVLAQLHTGVYAGSRLMGQSVSGPNGVGVGITFTQLVTPDGLHLPIQAQALDGEALSSRLTTEVDHKILARFVVKPLAHFVTGMAQAILTPTTRVMGLSEIGGTQTIEQRARLTSQEKAQVAAGHVAQEVLREVDKPEFTRPTTTVPRNEALGIVFLTPVHEPTKRK
jgi:hypothetical protein